MKLSEMDENFPGERSGEPEQRQREVERTKLFSHPRISSSAARISYFNEQAKKYVTDKSLQDVFPVYPPLFFKHYHIIRNSEPILSV